MDLLALKRDLGKRFPEARAVWHRIKRWRGYVDVKLAERRGDYLPPSYYSEQLREFLRRYRDSEQPLVVILSTTKPLSTTSRSNRPMAFASALQAQGHPVIYVYWRWRTSELCERHDGGSLLQLPVDALRDHFSELATFGGFRATPLFVVSAPVHEAAVHLGLLKRYGWRTVYECRDDWHEFSLAGQAPWYEIEFEAHIARNVDRVVSVSPALAARLESFGLERGSVEVVPNGYSRVFRGPEVRAYLERGRPEAERVVGYFGHLTAAWFDWDLVLSHARANPDLRYELIGFGAPERIALPENVVLRDAMPQAELVIQARRWSAAIIPFRFGRLAAGVDPIKIYEYLALGLPTVSVHMMQLERLPYVELYRDAAEYSTAIARALETRPAVSVIDQALEGAAWDERAATLVQTVCEER